MSAALCRAVPPWCLLDPEGSLAWATCVSADAPRGLDAAEGWCGTQQSLSTAMEAEQHLFWWSTGLCMRDFFCRESVGRSEFFFSGPIGLLRFFGLVQQTKQRKNASK